MPESLAAEAAPPLPRPTTARWAAVFLVLVMAALSGWQSVVLWRDNNDDAEQLVSALARSLDYQLSAELAEIDNLLQEAAARIDPERWPEADAARLLVSRLRAIPNLRGFRVATAEGQSVGGMLTAQGLVEAPEVTLADREYHAYHRDQPEDHGLHIGTPIISRIDGVPVIPLSRAIIDGAGRFRGTVVATVDTNVLSTMVRSALVEDQGATVIARLDGIILVRVPGNEEYSGKSARASPLFSEYLPHARSGIGRYTAAINGVPKIVGYRTLDHYPLVVTAGVSIDTAFDAWRANAWHLGLVLVAFALGSGVLATLLDQREHARALLARKVEDHARDLRAQLAERTRELEDRFRIEFEMRDAQFHHRLQSTVAEAENRAKSELLAAATHDLYQPLCAARLRMEALIERLGDDGDVRAVGNGLDTLADLLEEFIEHSRAERSPPTPEIAEVALDDVIGKVIEALGGLAAAKGLALRTVRTSLRVETDASLLNHILLNLIANAIRYTDKGGVLVGCRRRPGRVRIEVWDTGRGIPEDRRQEIFQQFRRLDEAEPGPMHGVGLGLSIVERACKVLGAVIDLRSVPGRGSVFAVEIAA